LEGVRNEGKITRYLEPRNFYHNRGLLAPFFMVRKRVGQPACRRADKGCRLRLVFLAALVLWPGPRAHAAPEPPQPVAPAPTYSMDDCLQLALDRNPDILRAQHDIERTQGLIISAKSALYPHANVSGRIEERDDDLFNQGTDPSIQRFRDFWVVELQVVQSLYSGGVNRQQIAIAKLAHEAALIQLQATIDNVLQQVKTTVYAVIVDEAQREAENQTIQLLREEGQRQKDLFDAGRTTRFNVLRTQVSLGNQQAQLSELQTDLTARQIALSRLLDLEWPRAASPFQPPFHVRASLDCPPVDKIDVEDFITLALARRPELQVIDRQIEIAQRTIKIDQAANVPRIDAYISDQEFRDQTLSSFNNTENGYAFGLLGTWNIFDGFAGRGQVMTDTASLASQRVSRDQLRLAIAGEVREAYARLATAEMTIKEQAANQSTAEESVKLARVSADSGYATLLDVLQATLDLTAARADLIRSRQVYLNALADLEHAVSLKFVDWPGKPFADDAGPAAAPAVPATTTPPPALLAPLPPNGPATLHP
jgi:outer membrane protein